MKEIIKKMTVGFCALVSGYLFIVLLGYLTANIKFLYNTKVFVGYSEMLAQGPAFVLLFLQGIVVILVLAGIALPVWVFLVTSYYLGEAILQHKDEDIL